MLNPPHSNIKYKDRNMDKIDECAPNRILTAEIN